MLSFKLVQILHDWINASLLESYECNKGLYEVAASLSAIPNFGGSVICCWGALILWWQ